MTVRRYATDEERREALRRTWRESNKRRFQEFMALREELGVFISADGQWSKGLQALRRLKAARDAQRDYQVCPECGMDTLHDENGVCLFCFPSVRVSVTRCDNEECGVVIERPYKNQRFCSHRCKDAAWRRTDKGAAWAVECKRRRQARRAARRAA